MSEKLCTLRTKGGGGAKYTETSLWTNPSPSNAFAQQDVTLSESFTDYKYLKIKYRFSTTDAREYYVVYPQESVASAVASSNDCRLSWQEYNLSVTGNYVRFAYRPDTTTTSLNITNARQVSGTSTSNNYLIPLEILGLNELDHGKRFDETVLWTNSASSSTFAAQEITLSDDIDNYDYIAIDYKYANNTSDGDYSTVMQTPANIKKGGYNTSVTRCGLALDYISGGNANYARQVFYVSDTKLRFDIGRQFGGTNSSNANAIPLKVVGCKFR